MRICDPLLPVFAREFDVTLAAAAATTTGFAIAYGSTQLFFGPLGDRIGRLRVIVVVTLIAALCSAASAVSSTLPVLVATRIATGAFAAAAIPLSLAWIGDQVPFAERQPVLARYLIGQMLGMTAGQIGGGVLSDWIGWRSAFVLIALLFAGSSILLWRSMSAADRRPPEAIPTISFVRRSALLFQDRWARTVLVTVMLEGTILFGAVALIASFLQREFGVSTTVAGTVTALFGLGGIFYATNARQLLGALGVVGVATAGGACFAAAMALLILQTGWQPAVVATLVAGLGYYMLHNTLQTQATQLSPQARGAALAWFASLLWLGQGVGIAAAAALAERTSFGWVFGIAGAALLLLAVVFGQLLKRRQRGA